VQAEQYLPFELLPGVFIEVDCCPVCVCVCVCVRVRVRVRVRVCVQAEHHSPALPIRNLATVGFYNLGDTEIDQLLLLPQSTDSIVPGMGISGHLCRCACRCTSIATSMCACVNVQIILFLQ